MLMFFASLLDFIPEIAAGLVLGAAALIILLTVYRAHAPAAPGIALGYYEVVGRYAGNTFRSIKGTLVETNMFLNADVARGVKQILVDTLEKQIKGLKGDETKNKTEIDACEGRKKELEKADLKDVCRVVVTRERLSEKHVLLQWGHVDKPLNAYALHEAKSRFSFGFGWQSQGKIIGRIHSEEKQYKLPKIGSFQLHYFNPDVPGEGDQVEEDPPEYLKTVALLVPASLELNEQLRSKDEEVRDLRRQLNKMGEDLSAKSTELDGCYQTLKGFGVNVPLDLSSKKKTDALDFFFYMVPTLIGYAIAATMSYGNIFVPAIGMIVGLLFGGALSTVIRR